MKKTLAILLALLMVCSALAATLSVSATEETDWEAVANELELTVYVGDEVTTAPAQDGVISDGEYTATKTTAVADLSAGNGNGEVQGEDVVEYFAHDAANFYYAIVFTQTNDNRACWPQFMVNNSFNVFTDDTGNNINDYHNRATLQARYLADGSTINNGIGTPRGAATPTFAEDGDFWVNATKSAENVKTYEFKFAKSYFATAAGVDAADVRVIPMWTYFHAATSTAHVLTAEDMEVLTAAGVGTIRDFGVGKNMYNYIVLDTAEEPADPAVNLQDLYGATYVGAPLAADAAKPVQDGVINTDEYQVEYVVAANGTADVARFGAACELLGDYKQYVAHDDEYFYVAFDFIGGESGLRGRFYWNLSFITSYDVMFTGGNTVNGAFTQDGYGIADGWFFGAEIKADPAEGYSDRENSVDRGTAPVKDTDFFIGTGKTTITEPADAEGNSKTHQTYEFKVSKAWYAAQVGLDSAADVRDLAWVVLGQEINLYASSYTQIGHYISDADIAALEAATGNTYTRPAASSHPYDSAMLPLLFVLDEDPNKPITNLADLYDATYVGAALSADAAKPVQDGKLTAGEYQIMFDGGEAFRAGVPAELIAPFKQYIAHDADYIYVAFEFVNGKSNTRGRLYWNVSFIDSFDFDFVGGTTVADAFKQNGNAINAGWNFGGEVKEDITEGYSDRNNAVPAGKVAPVLNEDFFVAIGRDTYTGEVTTNRQVYEFKVSKAWYAAQAGLESAADVRELAWVVLGEEINTGCSSYTQIGHYVTPEERAYLLEAYGVEFKPAAGNSHPYDNQMLPLLFVLDADPEGDAAAAPTEEVVPAQTWTSYVPAPVDPDQPGEGGDQPGGDQPGGDQPGGDQPGGDVVTTEPTTTAPSTTEAETTAAASTAKATTTAEATTAAETEAAKKGCKGSIAISALVLLPTLAGGALLAKRRRED